MEYRVRILRAMAELLEQTPLDQLAVRDICACAGVSRQTFYRRFEDKYAAASWYFEQIIERTCRKAGIEVTWRSGYLAFFRAIEMNPTFHQRLVASNDYNAMRNVSRRSVEEGLLGAYRERQGEPPALLAYQIHAFALLDAEMIVEWMAAGCKPPAEEFVDMFLSLAPREMLEAFDAQDEYQPGDMLFVVL